MERNESRVLSTEPNENRDSRTISGTIDRKDDAL